MKNSIVLIIIGIGLFFARCTPSPKEILSKSYNECQSIEEGYYEIEKQLKLMSSNDTIHIRQNSYFKKEKKDSIYSFLFNSQYFFKDVGQTNLLYTGREIVSYYDSIGLKIPVESRSNDILNYFWKNIAYKSYSPFTDIDSSPLLDINALDRLNIQYVGKDAVNNILCYHIKANVSPERDKSTLKMYLIGLEYEYWINKKNYIPIQISISKTFKLDGDTITQYEKLTLKNYNFNQVNDTLFNIEYLPENTKIKEAPSFERKKLLNIGKDAPDWTLSDSNSATLSLSGLKDNLVLLDFFFTSCPPCIKMSHILQNFHTKYEKKGLKVIGICPYRENKNDIENYKEKYNIKYTVLQAKTAMFEDYRISAYPTTYLISKEGKILFTNIGELLSSEIEDLEEIVRNNL